MSASLDYPAVGAWLLFSSEPTDRALAGWNALGNIGHVARVWGLEGFVSTFADEMSL